MMENNNDNVAVVADVDAQPVVAVVAAAAAAAAPPPRHAPAARVAAAAAAVAPTPSPRMLARREQCTIAFEDLYSSDRRKPNKKISEQASYVDARPSRTATTGPNPTFAVGLDTRELCLVQSMRVPSRNGLI